MNHKENETETSEKRSRVEESKDQAEDNVSYREYIKAKIKEKALKFREELFSLEHRAADFLNSVYKVVQKNQHIREYLKSMKNYYMNYLFNYFGYKYESIIENPNFFHFISQAWLVNAFEMVKESSTNMEDYASLLEKLLEVDVEKQKLISSLELITETIYISDPAIKLTELTLGKNFLKNIKIVLNERKRKGVNQSENINKQEFGVIFMEILKKTVNLTINEMDIIDNNNGSTLVLYETFNEMSAKKEDFSLEEYTTTVESRREGSHNNSQDITITNACEAFYYFSQCSVYTLLIDLELFNQQYTSLISKVKIIADKKKRSIKNNISNFRLNFRNYYQNLKNNLKYSKLLEFYEQSFNKLKNLRENSTEIVISRYNYYREWVTNSKVQDFVYIPRIVFEKASAYSSNTRIFLLEKVFEPSKNITLTITGTSTNFVLKNVENIREASKTTFLALREKSGRILANFKEDYVDKYIRIYVDEDKNVLVIEIERKAFDDLSMQFRFVGYLYDKLKNIKFREQIHLIYKRSKELPGEIKHNIIEKYHRFLSLMSNDSERKKN